MERSAKSEARRIKRRYISDCLKQMKNKVDACTSVDSLYLKGLLLVRKKT